MSSVEEKHFLRLIKFSYDLSLKVTRTFTKTNILHHHDNSFVKFLDFYKHDIYHLWNYNTRCCACSSKPLHHQHRELNKDQFIKLYDIQGTTSPGHFKKGTGNSVIQHCLCCVTSIASCSLNDLDIILIHTVIRKCVTLSPDDDMWLQTIREVRNNLAHAVSTTCFDRGRLEKWWFKLEGSVLGLAGKVPPLNCYLESIEDQIKLLKIADLDRHGIQEIISRITAENKKLTDEVIQQSEEIKETTNHHLDQLKEGCNVKIVHIKAEKIEADEMKKVRKAVNFNVTDGFLWKPIVNVTEKVICEMLIDIKNLIFEVRTHGLHHQLPATEHQTDSDTCYVEWRVKTPNEWQVEQIKVKLDQFKTLLQGCFKLEFVYVGCLVMETSVPRHILADDNLFLQAVRSFLEKLVEVCQIDTATTSTVYIDLSVLPRLKRGLPSLSCDLCLSQSPDVSSISWCRECDVKLCIECRAIHSSVLETKNHHMLEDSFIADLQLDPKGQQYCSEHAQMMVGYYCQVHDVICCQLCIDDKHMSCELVLDLDSMCKDRDKSIIEELGSEIKSIDKLLATLEDETHKYTLYMHTESRNIEIKIAQAKTKALDRIFENERALLSELQYEKTQIITKNQKVKEECKRSSKQLFLISKKLNVFKENGTAKQVLILAHHLKPTVQKINDSVADIVSNMTRITMNFDAQQDLVPSILGCITKTQQAIQINPHKTLKSFNVTSTFTTVNNANITGMVYAVDNKLLLCNFTYKYEVLVYNDNGQYLSAITMTERPFDIAVIPGGDKYVVTLPWVSSIQYINSKHFIPGKCVRLPTNRFIYGISTNKQHMFIGGENVIFVLNFNGTLVREIQLEDFSYVTSLAATDKILYASDQYDGVYCIDQNETIRDTQITGEGMIRKIILDRQGFIYVGGQESGKIHRLDKDWKENMTLGHDKVIEITAICFNQNYTKLFVASVRGKTVVVFTCS